MTDVKKFLLCIILWLVGQKIADAINCLQCDTVTADHKVSTENDKSTDAVKACHRGQVKVEPCTNPNHTHCVTYYFTSLRSREITLLWRKCGIFADTTHPCRTHDVSISEGAATHSIFDVANTADDDEIANDNTVERPAVHNRPHRQSKNPSYVEVCVYGCDTDGCLVNGAVDSLTIAFPFLLLIVFSQSALFLLTRRISQ